MDRSLAVLARVESMESEMVEFARQLIRIPTVNPPGENYTDCAEMIAERLESFGLSVTRLPAHGQREHSAKFPRVNVVGVLEGAGPRPCLHLNGHIDVVPPGAGWTVDPFAAELTDGRLYGRGSADMKAGLAAAVFAVEALRRSQVRLKGRLEISATVDEESGGEAGVAWLARHGWLDSSCVDHVIIPEPLDVDRICIGHRGVYWFKLTARGRMGHGSMPFLGTSAIEAMGRFVAACREEFHPLFQTRKTTLPVVPSEARHPSLNCNAICGGQAGQAVQTPCIPDHCEAVFDRRYLPEETLEQVRAEILELTRGLERSNPDWSFKLEDLMHAPPVRTDSNVPLVQSLSRSIGQVLNRTPKLVASPGTYDHKHVTHLGGIKECVAYGPGRLDLAHQPDEYCVVQDLVDSAKVIALTAMHLLGTAD